MQGICSKITFRALFKNCIRGKFEKVLIKGQSFESKVLNISLIQ